MRWGNLLMAALMWTLATASPVQRLCCVAFERRVALPPFGCSWMPGRTQKRPFENGVLELDDTPLAIATR